MTSTLALVCIVGLLLFAVMFVYFFVNISAIADSYHEEHRDDDWDWHD